MQFMNLKVMECHSQELEMEKFIKELLVVNQEIKVKEVKPTDAAQLLIEPDTVCFILFSEEL